MKFKCRGIVSLLLPTCETRPQASGSKVFQHLPYLFDIGQHLFLHLALPIFHFIYSFHLLHLLLPTLQSILRKDRPVAIPAGCSTLVLSSPHNLLKVSPRLQGGTAGDYSPCPRHGQALVCSLLHYCLLLIPGASHLGLDLQRQT